MLTIEIDRETDGRWIGEVLDLPGVLAYGTTRDEAVTKVTALALRVIADRLEHCEQVPFKPSDSFVAKAVGRAVRRSRLKAAEAFIAGKALPSRPSRGRRR